MVQKMLLSGLSRRAPHPLVFQRYFNAIPERLMLQDAVVFLAVSSLLMEKQLFQDEAVFSPFPCFIRALTTEKMGAA